MKNNEYWKKRALANERKVFLRGEREINDLKRLLLQNQKSVKKQIKAFYDKYSETYAEQLTFKELLKYKKDLKLNAKKYPKDKILYKRLKEDIPKYRIDRLRALDSEIQYQLAYLTHRQELGIKSTLDDVADMCNIQTVATMRAMGIQFNTLSNRILQEVINETWVGKMNWSERIWADRVRVGHKVTDILRTGLPQGTSLQKMSLELANSVQNTFTNAFRLIRTESTHVSSKVDLKAYDEALKEGIAKYYIYEAVLDDRTSDICEELNGKRFKISEAEIGVNFPPAHVQCRSVTVLDLDNEEISATDNQPEQTGDMVVSEMEKTTN